VQKNIFYDESARVPMLMRWPGVVPAGHRSDACLQHFQAQLQRRLTQLNDTFECITWYRDPSTARPPGERIDPGAGSFCRGNGPGRLSLRAA
jgi:hypothetical protein